MQVQEIRSCRSSGVAECRRRLFGLETVIHPLPGDEEFDSLAVESQVTVPGHSEPDILKVALEA